MLKEEKAIEKESFKKLSTKKKIEHIKEYYTIHIVSVIIGIIVIYSFVNIWVINPVKKPFVNITFLGQVVDHEKVDQLERELIEKFPQYTNDKETILVDGLSFGDGKDPNVTMAMQTRLSAGIQTKEIDIIVADSEVIKQYGEMGTFMDLEKVFTKEELKKIDYDKVKFSEIENLEDDQVKVLEPRYYGIDISSIEKLNKLIEGDNVVAAIVANSDRLQETKEVLNYFLTQK